MFIEIKPRETYEPVTFGDLEVGDVFIYNETAYMKTHEINTVNNKTYNIIRLDIAQYDLCFNAFEVIPCEATLTLVKKV